MGLKTFIVVMLLTTVLAWSGWAVIVFMVNPTAASAFEFMFFYASLLLSLIGTLSLIGIGIRWLFQGRKRGQIYRVSMAFRQACLWALALVTALALQSQRLLSWWLIILLVIAFATMEFTLLILSKPRWEE